MAIGGLLGITELVIECFDMEDRSTDGLLRLERCRLDDDWVDARRLTCLSVSIRVEFGWRRLRPPLLVLPVLVVPFR